jgi:glycosyltransferase involved in cell wall biosynthesis
MKDSLTFVVPGSLETRTGGYAYDRKIIEGLRKNGWTVALIELSGSYSNPDEKALAHAEDRFAAIADGTLVIIDGLAFGVLPEIAAKEHSRLNLVGLVHHPLADETGLGQSQRERLVISEAKSLGFAHQIIATSHFTFHRLVELGVGAEKTSVVEPGAIAAPLSKGRAGAVPETPMRMLCPASYIPRKGHADLLRAMSGLKDLHWKLICVGNTRLEVGLYDKICALRDAHGLGAQVELRDEVKDGELDELYSTADLVVLASHYEGFGMVVTEAIARGLPVITTTGGALADTLPEGAGLASAPGDIETLEKNLRKVLTDDNSYARLVRGARTARASLSTWDEAVLAFADALNP